MELFVKLGLKEVAGIVSTMAECKENGVEFSKGSFSNRGTKYEYLLDDNNLIIRSSDGRSMNIIINAEEKEFVDYRNRKTRVLNHEVNLFYYMPDGKIINLNKEVGLQEGYKGFYGIPRDEIYHGAKVFLLNKDGEIDARYSVSLDTVYLDDKHKKYEFGKDGISYGNKTVSLDGDELLVMNNRKVENVNELMSYDGSKEKFVLARLMHSDRDVHPITKKIIEEDTFKKIDAKHAEIEEIKEFYDKGIYEVRNAIGLRNSMMNYVEKYTFGEDELGLLEAKFRKDYLGNQKVKKIN